nr:MAG TPA: hypothetical protein [Caudoviricetes sp.]
MIRKGIERPSEKKNRRIETALKFKFRGCYKAARTLAPFRKIFDT